MSILQNLKILNKPIAELAMLPQEAIIKLAQSGQIPVGFVAPILGEKAEQTKAGAAAAAMMTQQQMPQPTVLEKIMAENAVGEVQSQLPEDVGIGALPVSDESLPDEYAGGGIVAFQGGGTPLLVPDTFEDKFKRRQELYKQFVGENEAAKNEIDSMAADAQQQRAMRLIEAGLGIASGTSPYFAANLKGAMPAIQGYAGDIAEQRKRKTALTAADRAEKLKLFEGTLEDEAKLEAAKLAAGKGTDMSRFIDNFVTAARARGDKTDEAVLKQMGGERYLALYGASQLRGGAAAEQADIAGRRLEQTAREKAAEAVEKSLGAGGNRDQQKEFNRRAREDREANTKSGAKPGDPNYSNKAQEYKNSLINDYLNQVTEPKSQAAKPAAPKAEAAKPAAPKAEAAKAPSINIGNDMTTERLTGAELRQRIAELKDHPNRDALAKRLRESEVDYKRRIFAEKNPKKITSQEEYNNLSDGTVYQLPNGTKGIKGGVAQTSISAPTGAKPTAALPPGAKQIGTSGGKPVYQLPDGSRMIQQ